MNKQCFMIALVLVLFTGCQGGAAADPDGTAKPLDSADLSRLAHEHQAETRKGNRDSDDTFIPPGTPVEMTGLCEIARDIPLFAIDWPGRSAGELPDWRKGYRAHLANNREAAQMKEGKRYLVKGRIMSGETMCYGAYFIDVESFTAIDE